MDLSKKSRFVNRTDSINALMTHYKNCKENSDRHVVFISGEAGIGKTRLVREFKSRIEKDDCMFLEGACIYSEDAEPYLPFIQAMGEHLNHSESPQNFSMGLMGVTSGGHGVEAGVAALGLMSTAESGAMPRGENLQDKKSILFESFVQAISRLSQDRCLVLFLDDFQWADTGSAQMMMYLARNIKDMPVLMCVAYRPEELEDQSSHVAISDIVKSLNVESYTASLSLGRLKREHIAEMTRSILDREEIPDNFIDVLYRESDGNPFFVEEVLKALISEGVIDLKSSTWDAVSLSRISIPRSIRDVVSRRILRLDEETLRVLRYAAIVGNKFTFEMLREVTELDEERLVNHVDSLMDNRLIHEDASSEEEEFVFDHIQIITVVYEGMSRSRLRVMHKRVGEALEDRYKDNLGEAVYALAKHFFVGKVPEKAVPYAILAAKRATASYALDNALNYYFMALNIIERFPSKNEFQLYKGDVLFNIGWIENMLGEWDSAMDHYVQAAEMNKELGNKRRMADTFREMGHLHMERNEWEKADKHYKQALEIYTDLGDYYGIADTYRGHAKVDWRLGRLEEAVEHLNQCIQNAIRVGDDSLIGSSYIDMGNVYSNKGDAENAEKQYLKAIEILEKAENYPEVARAYNNMGEVFKDRGELERAQESYRKSLEYAEKGSDVRTKGYALGNLGETYAKMGDLDKAEYYTEAALDLFERIDERYVIASLYMNYGILYSKKGDWDKAEASFKKGVEMMKALNIQYDLGVIYMEYGKTLAKKGDSARAKELVSQAAEIFEQIGAKAHLETAQNVLNEIAGAG
ncbi:MAG: tetratricopeptide repeat protein [Candidatus Thermoplasmatota archaeon]|nr:tetratricopeptide repeat protein [Candidatus Thermoplasmatota archaeon]